MLGVVRLEAGDGIDVAEAGIVGAAGDPRHRRRRARTLVELDVEASFLEPALVLGDEEPGLRPLPLPIEDELDLDRIGRLGGAGEGDERWPRRPSSACVPILSVAS
jgi:hypothetical protein